MINFQPTKFFILALSLTILVVMALVPARSDVRGVQAAPPAEGGPTPRVYLPLISESAGPLPTATPVPLPTTTPPPSGGDWAMLAANPQRTSWTAEEVRGNLQLEWYHPIEPYIPTKVQPIAADGNIYVSTARGLYAFRASDGALLWVYATELPLGQSPTIATVNDKSVAYLPGYDDQIHAVDALTGQALAGYTPYVAQAGFETNPLVIYDSAVTVPTIFAGNRDGNLYALNAVTGAMIWSFQTGGPITFSAAYKDGVVYVASNDMYAYAVNAADGSQIWKSQKFPGQSFMSYWPVVYTNKSTGKDYVIFDSGENYRDGQLTMPITESQELYSRLQAVNLPLTANPVSGDWVKGTITMNASVIAKYYQDKPYRRNVYVLDAANGSEFTFDSNGDGIPEYAPFSLSGVSHAGSKYPPVINGIDGVYYQQTAYDQMGAWIDRGGAVGWKFGTKYLSKVQQQPGNPDTDASDEPTAYSSGGRLIYSSLCCDRIASGFDVTIPFGQPNRSWSYFSYNLADNVLAPGYQQMYNNGDPTLYNNLDGWQVYSGKNQSKNGMYGKIGMTQSPPIPYQGKLYILRGNALLAFSATGTNTKTPLPLATVVNASSSSTTLDRTALATSLSDQIQKMIAAGPLRPGYRPNGQSDQYGMGWYGDERAFGEIFDYFSNPSDTVVTLLAALPYLSSTQQTQLKTYLQTYYGPGSPYDFAHTAHVGWQNGASRGWSDIPPDLWALNVWDTNTNPNSSNHYPPLYPKNVPICPGGCGIYWKNFPPFNFYAAWKYAQVFGNAKSIFDSMSSKIEAPPSDLSTFIHKPYFLNQYLAGYKGYLELQKLAGYSPSTTVQSYYNAVLNARISNFSKDTYYVGTNIPNYSTGESPFLWTLSVAQNFMFLTPEVADLMNQNIKSQVQTAVNEYNYVAPYWFVSGFDDTVNEGTYQTLYDSPAMFQAKAWILKQPFSELVKWLDAPAFEKGDLFYIQNLVAALSAP